MSTRKSSFFNMVSTLVLVTGGAALALGFVYQWTKEPIAQATIEKQMRAIRSVTGEYTNDPLSEAYQVARDKGEGQRFRHKEPTNEEQAKGEKKSEEVLTFYPAKLTNDQQITAISAYSDNGYSGRIELMVGIDENGAVRNIEVVSHLETPGLGSKIKDQDFIEQFIGKTADDFDMRVTNDGGEVDGISGATISSRAFCEAVQQALDAFNETKDEKRNNLSGNLN